MAVPGRSRVVVIGGGVIGCSVAYHLAKRGVRDVVLLERLQLTHGATWHAAGLVGQLRSSSNLTRIMRYSAELYGNLEAETGQATGWHKVGSLRLASSPARWQELSARRRWPRASGSTSISCRRARPGLFPLLEPKGVVGAAWIEGDGYVDPTSLTNAYAAGARAGGVIIAQGVRVTGLKRDGRRVTTVITDAGNIETECVINATGMWGREIAAMTGTRVPACAVEHQYFVTDKTDRIPAGLPPARSRRQFLREARARRARGRRLGIKHEGVGRAGIARRFRPQLLQPDFDRFAPLAEAAARIPALNEIGIRR
jgi:4-methylaminobutanoate oxidase (formaldehyde-forming)